MLRTLTTIFRELTYWDMARLLRLGKKRPLEAEDLDDLPEDYTSASCTKRFGKLPTTGKWAFILGLGRGLGWLLALIALLVCAIAITNLLETYYLKRLLEALSQLDGVASIRTAFELAGPLAIAFAAASMAVSLSIQYYIHALVKGEMLLSNNLNDHIYRHALTLSAESRQKKSVGDLVNLLGADTDKLAELYSFLAELLYLVLITVVVFWFSYDLVGPSAIWGALLAICISPIAYYTSKKFVHFDDAIMAKRDQRVSLMSQILSGIRVVKYFGWEQHFAKEVDAFRHQEMALRRKFVLVRVASSLIWSSSRILGAILVIGLETYNGRELSALWVFPLLSIYALLIHPYSSLSMHISEISSGLVSAQRIVDFLRLPSRQVAHKPLAPAFSANSRPDAAVIRLDKLTLAYGDQPVISGLNLRLAKGQKLAVVGKVGAGKSSLIAGLLGEMPPSGGDINKAVDAKLGFSGQQSFIQTGTIADNIRFGADASGDLAGCAADAGLTADLNQLVDGLHTEIGENGINLSGGQKQRLSLARVAYSDPDLILLDDPLSAVDPDMEDHLADQLIWGRWQDKTVVMTSHRLGHLPRFDQVLFLAGEGKWHLGSYDELLERLPEFRAWVAASERADASRAKHQRKLAATAAVAKTSGNTSGVRAVADEDRVEGTIGWDVYGKYLARMGGRRRSKRKGIYGAMLISLVLAAVTAPLFDYWLSVVVSAQDGSIDLPLLGSLPWQASWLVPSLIVLALLVVCAEGLQSGYWALRALIAGKDLHDEAFQQVVKAPVQFFDKNPVGRVLNRFSRDVDVVENEMAVSSEYAIVGIAMASIGVIAIGLVMPVSLLSLIPVGVLIYRIQDLFRASGREIKRLYSISRSPRFAHFKETIEGLSTIRAFSKEEAFYGQYVTRLEANQKTLLAMVLTNRWFSVRIPFLGNLYTLAVALLVVYFAAAHGLSAALAGFVLLYCLNIWGNVTMFVREFKNLESNMTSVERLNSYGRIEAEPEVIGAAYPHVATWQQDFRGEIAFDDVWLRYEPKLPDVLKGLSFTIAAGQKVGIIGRTGAGKSTVFSSLYRFVRPYKGCIRMDGVPIDTIPIAALRRQMAIIPQDPTLFTGTLRSNLDRFDAFTDEEIWQALEKVDLAEAMRAMPDRLAEQVVENGANFSAGERQLLCLARAILLDTKIIILDEATASVDILTDEKIQNTIRRQFADKTVLIIAHRLATVADCDLVIELKDGAVHKMMAGANRGATSAPNVSPAKANAPQPAKAIASELR